jgi:IS30 family transposase
LSSLRSVKKGPKKGPGRVRCRPNVSGSWSCGDEGGASSPRPARLVSRTTANNWSRGYKTFPHGQVVGFVPAVERLAVRGISLRFVSQEERIEIADLRTPG